MQYSHAPAGCQPEERKRVNRGWTPIGRVLWPATCVLCLSRSERTRDLCLPCERELVSNPVCCRLCSQPLFRASGSLPVCGSCLRARMLIDSSFVPFRYEYPLDRLVQRLKYGKELSVARVLGEVFADKRQMMAHLPLPEAIIPVPLGKRRYRERGFNQAHEIARAVAHSCKISIQSDLVERARETQEQAGLPRRQRKRNVRGAFRVRCKPTMSHVAIFDDVVTTGSTVNELARALRRAGVERIQVWAIARAGR